jgi:Glucose inhibited division protein A
MLRVWHSTVCKLVSSLNCCLLVKAAIRHLHHGVPTLHSHSMCTLHQLRLSKQLTPLILLCAAPHNDGIQGLESVEIVRPGYDVEYDYVQPTSLRHTLETKQIEGLYLAGQVSVCQLVAYIPAVLCSSSSEIAFPFEANS